MENVMENVFYCNGKCVLNLLNFVTLRNSKVQDKKHFAENGKEKLFPNDSSFLSNLKCHNEYYPDNADFRGFCKRTRLQQRTRFQVPMFPISLLKRNL